MLSLKYNVVGHTCPRTYRIAMTVKDVIDLEKRVGDVASFLYTEENAELGLDPWRLIDGINPAVREPTAELWFDNGGSKLVPLGQIVYVQQPKDARKAQVAGIELAGAFARGQKNVGEIIDFILAQEPKMVAYLTLSVAASMPDQYELQLRTELLRRIAKP